MERLLQALGGAVLAGIRGAGSAGIFLADTCVGAVAPPPRIGRITRQIHFIGVKSVAVIALTALFSGMVLGLQGYHSLRKVGATSLLGPTVALSLIRELGPVLAALMVAARAGSAMAAELGIMRISEQIDAIEVMGLHPIGLLVSPRLIGGVVALPLLAAMFDVVGIAGGYLTAVALLGVDRGAFFSSMSDAVTMSDITGGVVKAIAFGALVVTICSWRGFYAGFGAAGVSRATTQAVVASSVLVLVSDYVLTSVLFS